MKTLAPSFTTAPGLALCLALALPALGCNASLEGDRDADTDGATGDGDGGPTSGEGPDGPWQLFPIEVLGSGDPDEKVIATREIALDEDVATSDVATLYVQCHRCGFYDSPEFQKLDKPLTPIKVSLRVVGSATEDVSWLDVTDSSVELEPVAAAHGGLNGGLVTTSFRVVLDSATRQRLAPFPSKNKLEFRFNGTDGNSNGFRILDLTFEDSAHASLSHFTRRWADIEAQKKAEFSADDATAGKSLWHGHDLLTKSPIVQTPLRAACSSCHAEDGRDLQYFNYSDNSIIQRSRFHGLTEEQGQQIVAYLRSSLYEEVPHVTAAAPWNPPYQPGPGLDAKPNVEWAAGAGLSAILPDGAAFVRAFVGQAPSTSPLELTQVELDAAMDPDPKKPLNTREMAVPLQFPDWNAWLPITHPLDVWKPEAGETQGLFETKAPETENPQKVFERIRTWLLENKNPNGKYGDWTHLTPDQRQQIFSWLNDLGGKSISFAGGGRGTRESGDPENPFGVELGGAELAALLDGATSAQATGSASLGFSKQAFIERATFSVFHWMGVKQWELAHTFGLEGDQSVFKGKKLEDGSWQGEGAIRGWPFSWPSVFYMAPHMIYAPEQQGDKLREFYFSWEPRLVSYYRTNQWYQMQMSLNSGWAGASVGPMDWPYHLGFTTGLVDDLRTAEADPSIIAAHLARFFQIRTKLAQLANTDISFNTPDALEPNNLFKNTGMNSKADLLFKLGVTEIVHKGPNDWQKSRFEQLDAIAPGLYLMFVNGSLALYNSFFGETTADQYRRCVPGARMFGLDPDDGEFEIQSGQRFCLDAERTPLPVDEQDRPYLPGGWTEWTTEQNISWSIIAATQLGAEETRVQALSNWLDSMY